MSRKHKKNKAPSNTGVGDGDKALNPGGKPLEGSGSKDTTDPKEKQDQSGESGSTPSLEETGSDIGQSARELAQQAQAKRNERLLSGE